MNINDDDRPVFCSVCRKIQPNDERSEWWMEPLSGGREWIWCRDCVKHIFVGQGDPKYML